MGQARARSYGTFLNWQVKCHSASQPLRLLEIHKFRVEGCASGPLSQGTECPVPSLAAPVSRQRAGRDLSGAHTGAPP